MAGVSYVYSVAPARPRRRLSRWKTFRKRIRESYDDLMGPNDHGKHVVCGRKWSDHGEFGECPKVIPRREHSDQLAAMQSKGETKMREELISDYVAVGGAPAIKAVVEDFYIRVMKDDELAPYFEGIDLAKLKGHQAAFISEVMGGPKQYTGRLIVEAHQGRGITEHAFSKVAVHLLAALNEAGVPEEIATRTGQKAMGLRDAVVHGQETK